VSRHHSPPRAPFDVFSVLGGNDVAACSALRNVDHRAGPKGIGDDVSIMVSARSRILGLGFMSNLGIFFQFNSCSPPSNCLQRTKNSIKINQPKRPLHD
jgi:hypothetical protein